MKKHSKLIQIVLLGLLLLGSALIDWPAVVRSAKDLSKPSQPAGDSAAALVSDSIQAVQSLADRTKDRITRSAKLAIAADFENIDANLWGLTVDQDDVPLPGVTIQAHTRYWKPVSLTMAPGFIQRTAVSGPDGRFAITGDKGDIIAIELMEKAGYQLEKTAPNTIGTRADYGFSTNANHPIVFKLWKDTARQPLLLRDVILHVIPDGRAYTVDLASGKYVQSEGGAGDVRLRMKRPLTAGRWDHFAWTYDVEVVDGGLIELPREIYTAPVQGYTNQLQCFTPIITNRWDTFKHTEFVLKLRGGKAYARFKLEVSAMESDDPRDAYFKIHSAFNPTGSRKLN